MDADEIRSFNPERASDDVGETVADAKIRQPKPGKQGADERPNTVAFLPEIADREWHRQQTHNHADETVGYAGHHSLDNADASAGAVIRAVYLAQNKFY